jgi:hypothetical protein
MATITKNKGNGRNKIMCSDAELNTLTIALALLNIPEMEDEATEQGLSTEEVVYNHLELFDTFTKATKLYSNDKPHRKEDQQ